MNIWIYWAIALASLTYGIVQLQASGAKGGTKGQHMRGLVFVGVFLLLLIAYVVS
jgi:hypothetical protein